MIDIPAWALAFNDTDPDTIDHLFVNNIGSSSGGSAIPFGDVFFVDDATPGGTFTYEFSVSLPMFAQITFEKGASAYAAMTAAMGLGAVIGGLYTASRPRGEPRQLTVMALLFGLTVLVSALAPTLPLAIVALVAVGFCSIGFTALGNSTIQLASRSDMRGRVMSLWTVAFLGSTPIGGPIIGWIGEHGGPRWALALGGAAAIAAAAYGAMVFNRSGASLEAKEIPVDPAGASRPG